MKKDKKGKKSSEKRGKKLRKQIKREKQKRIQTETENHMSNASESSASTTHKGSFADVEEQADLSAHTAALNGDVNRLKELLKKDSDGSILTLTDTRGRSPLHYAAMGNSSKCVSLLLDHGATITDNLDNTNLTRKKEKT